MIVAYGIQPNVDKCSSDKITTYLKVFVEVGSSRSSTMRLPGPFIEYLMGCLMSGLIALILVFPLILSGG